MLNFFRDQKPQINEDIIQTLESYLGVKFPKLYRKYLIDINGGHSNKDVYTLPDNSNNFVTHHWYGIRSEECFSLLKHLSDRGVRYPGEFMEICDDCFGNRILLCVKGAGYGKVYFWDHEMETDYPTYDNLTLIANSFDEFLNNLKSEDEIEQLI